MNSQDKPNASSQDSGAFEREQKLRFLLDQVSFDTSDLRFDGEDLEERVRYWLTPQNDTVSLNFFSKQPDLPTSRNIDDFTQHINSMLGEVKGRLVEQDIRAFDFFHAVRQIVNFPNPNRYHGLVYIGSWIIPFKTLSYVVKVQCVEEGTTGVREALLFATGRAGSAGHRFEDNQVIMPDWNPDAAEFDAEFPTHPLSRLRPAMARLQASLRISASLKNCLPFPLPEPAH